MQKSITFLFGNTRNRLVIIGTLSAVFAFLGFYSVVFNDIVYDIFKGDLQKRAIPVIAILVSTAAFFLYYLQYGGKRDEDASSMNKDEILELKHAINRLENREVVFSSKLNDILRGLKKDIEVGKEGHKILSPEEKQKVILDLKEGIYKESANDFLVDQANELKETIIRDAKLKLIENEAFGTKRRLNRELRDLKLRANLNLVIGILITAGGMYLLLDTVSLLDSSENLKNAAKINDGNDVAFYKIFLLEFLPRLTLVVFIEIFAYFFLKLYKEGLGEIKYFQNELTNVESKILALNAATLLSSSESLGKVIDTLGCTERNKIFKKGQTTVELEKARSDGDLTKSVINAIPELFKSNKG